MEAMPWKYQAEFNATGWTPLQYGDQVRRLSLPFPPPVPNRRPATQVYGLYKTAGNFSFAKIFNAGHEVRLLSCSSPLPSSPATRQVPAYQWAHPCTS